MDASHFIGIDWGTTNARAMLFARDGRLLEQQEFPLGVKAIVAGGHREAFARMTGTWREQLGPIPVLLAGMVGSRTGWLEVPYLACPASLDQLARALTPVPGEQDVFIVPGLKMSVARPDVLRGEELQVLGLGASARDFNSVCIPGTHAKWIVTDGERVSEFHTAMTGEMFAAIIEHTLFVQLVLPSSAPGEFRAAAFDAGLERSGTAHGLLHAVFAVRAGFLLGEIAREDLADILSGLLIGTELRHMQALGLARGRVAILGASSLTSRYAHALRRFGAEPQAIDVAETTARGFVRLFESMGS